jgi:hypothetical protein
MIKELNIELMYARATSNVPTSHLGRQSNGGRDPPLSIEIQREPLNGWERLMKRALDLVLAVVAAVLLALVLLMTAVAIKIDRDGPVLFRQRRVGFGNREFSIYSTMTVMDDGEAVVQVRRGDWRPTRIGKLLRRSSIDELPQLRRTRGDRLFDVFQHEGELTGIDLFRPRAEAIALKLLDDGDQTLVLGLRGDEQRLEGACVVGKSGGVGMASQNQDQSPESPAKYIISTSRDRRRRPRSNPSHPYPIQPLQQSRELRRREPHHSIAQRRPAERACSSRLIARTKPVPSQNNNFTRSLRLERKT